MTDISLTPFKRRFVENWRKTVQKHLDDGSICRIVVAQIDDDEEIVEPPAEIPVVCLTPKNDKSRAKPLQREKSSSEKLAELAVNSSLHIKALPSVSFTYTTPNDRMPKRPISKTLKNPVIKKEETEPERPPIVIVDPQLMTPSGQNDVTIVDEQNSKTVEKSVKFPLRISGVSKQVTETNKYNKNRLPVFAKCKIQSSDQNSFVVSRSNFLKNGNLQNHSFLTLPVRFQVQSQVDKNLKASTESLFVERERSAVSNLRNTGIRLIKKLNNISTLNNVRNTPRLIAW